jgi:gluconokinase
VSGSVIVLMGVSGAGKTTVGELLAERLGATFAEGDAYHPKANVEKMQAGIALDDADREPWLRRLSAEIGRWLAEGRTVVLACSALKERYRAILKDGRAEVRFVHLAGDADLIGERLAHRRGHYMPPTLLPTQLAALEEPTEAITVDIGATPEAIVAEICARLAVPDEAARRDAVPARGPGIRPAGQRHPGETRE